MLAMMVRIFVLWPTVLALAAVGVLIVGAVVAVVLSRRRK